ncbi:hypothetical protein [Pseudomonas sp. PAGU 2196]|uniref:hypothetical protein n=1 Tax=Pseudomonas sp. PAGU 2196 TaxID=2793997 RepID=UPI001EDE09CC|nr:hypothetical protein [Pseudomonas sp. PAGU 2196]
MPSTTSSTAPLTPPTFSLCTYGAVRQRVADNDTAIQRSTEAAARNSAKRRAQHEVDMLAIEYAKIMMQKSIDEALNPATDARLRRDLRNDVLNRGIGKVAEPENPDKKKPDESPMVEWLKMLAAFNHGPVIVEASRKPQLGHTRHETIEHEATRPEPVAVVQHQAAPISDEDMDFDQLMEDITKGGRP